MERQHQPKNSKIMMDNVTICTRRWLKPGSGVILSAILGFLLISNTADARNSRMNSSPSVQIAAQQLQLSELYVSRSDAQTPKVTLNVENAPLIDVLHQLANELNVNIFPNPNNGDFTLFFNENIDAKITIYNTLGKMVCSNNLINNNKIKLNLNLSQGIYYLNVNTLSGKQITSKLFVD